MQEIRTIKNTSIQYILDRDKRKNSYIQIKDCKVILKVPKMATEAYIDKLLNDKLDWINSKLQKCLQSNANLEYTNNSLVPVLGKKMILNINYISESKRIQLKNFNDRLIINLPAKYGSTSEIEQKEVIKSCIGKYYKTIAKDEVFAAMHDITTKVGLYPKEINIKNLSATWGICSSKKYISINQNLMMYSRKAIEYVCLHEICHLKYMNHSKDFWQMVEYYMPDYKEAKNELKNS